MKKTVYHVNKVVNKWEEEQHKKAMAKMIAGAKSSLPPAARSGVKSGSSPSKAGLRTRTGTNGVHEAHGGGGGGGGGHDAGDGGGGSGEVITTSNGANIDVGKLDELILLRLHEMLGQPMLQRIQSHNDGGGDRRPASYNAVSTLAGGTASNSPYRPLSVPVKGAKQAPHGARAKAAAVAAAVAKRRTMRPAWNEEWTSQMSVASSRNKSPAREARRPPDRSYSSPSRGAAGQMQTQQYRAPAPVATQRVAGTVMQSSSSMYPPSPAPAARYAHGPATHPDASLLTRSDVSAIATLNPSTVRSSKPPQHPAVQSPGPAVPSSRRPDQSLMSLSRMSTPSAAAGGTSSADAAGAAPNRSVARASSMGRPPSSVPPSRPDSGSTVRSGQGRRASEGSEQADPYADDYEADGFDSFDGEDEAGSAAAGGRQSTSGTPRGDYPAPDASVVDGDDEVLRQSLSALNALVQLKIHDVRTSQQQLRLSLSRSSLRAGGTSQADMRASQRDSGVGQQDMRVSQRDVKPSQRDVGSSQPDIKPSQRDSRASMGGGGAGSQRASADGSVRGSGVGGIAASKVDGAQEEDEEEDEDEEDDSFFDTNQSALPDNLCDALAASDLEYLSRLPPEREAEDNEAGESSDFEWPDDYEAGAPAGDGKQWGDDRTPFTATNGGLGSLAAATKRVQELKELRAPSATAGQRDGGGTDGDKSPTARDAGARRSGSSTGEATTPSPTAMRRSKAQEASGALAQDAQQLFGSLKQLHRLMSGPRGGELTSPPSTTQGGLTVGGFVPPTMSPSRPSSAASSSAASRGRSPARLQLPPDHHRDDAPRSSTSAARVSDAGSDRASGAVAARRPGGVALMAAPMAPAAASLGGLPAAAGGELNPLRTSAAPRASGAAAAGGSCGTSSSQQPELTPKHQLTPDDVLWMGGVMRQVRESLDLGSSLTLPGLSRQL